MSGLRAGSEIVERGLQSAARSASGGDCIVLVTDTFDADVRFANNTTTTNGERRDRGISVVRILSGTDGRRVGVASGSGTIDVERLVEMAEIDAKGSTPAEDEAPLVEGAASLDFSDGPISTDLSVFDSVLPELADAFGRARSDGTVLAGFATHSAETLWLGSSSGIRRRVLDRSGTLELVGRGDGGARSAWSGVGTADFSDVSLSSMEAKIAERLEWARRRVELPAGRYEVLLPPDAVADLVLEAYFNLGGQDAEDGGTVFSAPGGGTRVGEVLSPLPFEMWSDPETPGISCPDVLATGTSSSEVSVFDNGSKLERTTWVGQGRLAHLRYHRAGAKASGVPFAPPIDNLSLELPGSRATLDELVENCDRGLLLTCLWYIREVDPATLLLTGLTRDGVYLVEHGEVVAAVNNFRFNESPIDVLRDTLEAGRPERALSREWGEWMQRTRMPALRVGEFNMSSVSPAS